MKRQTVAEDTLTTVVLPSISFRNPVVHLDKNTIRFFNNYTEASVYMVNGSEPGTSTDLFARTVVTERTATSMEVGICNVWVAC